MPQSMRFRTREDGGRKLAALLERYANRPDVIVLGLPRGGVPVAAQVAGALSLPLDVLVVRKVGAPGREELAMGAVAGGGAEVVNDRVLQALGISRSEFQDHAAVEREALNQRERELRGNRPPLVLGGKTVILVDDGLATGASMRVAAHAARTLGAVAIVVAVPAAAAESRARLEPEVDEIVTVIAPDDFRSVGLWYDVFDQTSDEEVKELLERWS